MKISKIFKAMSEPRTVLSAARELLVRLFHGELSTLRGEVAALHGEIQKLEPMQLQLNDFSSRLQIVESSSRAQSEISVGELLALGIAPMGFKERFILPGFPGAGNLLAQTVCEKLLEADRLSRNIGREFESGCRCAKMVEKSFSTQHDALIQMLKKCAPQAKLKSAYLQHTSEGRADYFALYENDDFLIYAGLNTHLYLNAVTHSTHELLTAASCAFYRESGFNILAVVRHPLDIIVSYALKVRTNIDNWDLMQQEAKRLNMSIKETVALLRIRNKTWLRALLTMVKKYYLAVANFTNPTERIYYEKLLRRRGAYLGELAGQLGFTINEASLNGIAAIIGTTPLDPFPGSRHFNKPSTGKWRNYFSDAEIDEVCAAGLDEVVVRLGYEPIRQTIDAPPDDRQLKTLNISADDPNLCLVGFDDYLPLFGTFGHKNLADWLGLQDKLFLIRFGEHHIISTQKSLIQEFEENLMARTRGEVRYS